MKTKLTLLVLFISICAFAQNGINYKALIKDDNGNVIASSSVDMQFIIYEGASLTNNVYQENHTINTDANGFVIVNIGEGATSDDFTNVNWSADEHYLNVQADIGSGLVDLGTTQFMVVPYAINAEIANNVRGLEALDEGNGIGWRLIGKDSNKYGNIGQYAVDLSFSLNNSEEVGATGIASFAIGERTIASGLSSLAMGVGSEASGSRSTALGSSSIASGESSLATGTATMASSSYTTAMGSGSTASGLVSTAIGYRTTASGGRSTAFGSETVASSFVETAIGNFNVDYVPNGISSWAENDRLFVIGNGTSDSNRSNALTVLKNGNLGITTAEPEVKLHVTGGTDAGLNQDGGYVVLGNTNGRHMVFDNNEIMVKEGNQPETLFLNNDGGFVSVGGTIINSSDRRLKKEIERLPYGLNEVLQLIPKQYYWKNRGEQNYKSIGLIAQEVQPIINEIVHKADNEDKTLSVSYIELIPVLINAIQEQQRIIENSNKNYQALLERVEQLEAKSSN